MPEVQAPPTVVETPIPTPRPTAEPTPDPTSPTPTPPLEAEPGLTATTMTVAVIADVGAEGVIDERGVSAWQGVQAWAAAVNSRGGLAGRTVEVVTIDSSLFDHQAAMAEACAGEIFALVGSAALFDADGLDVLLGADCSLPDFPSRASTPERQRSPNTFVSNPVEGAVWNAGAARYHAAAHPEAAAAVGTVLLQLPPTIVAGERKIEANSALGFGYVFDPVVPFDADPATVAEGIAQAGVRALSWSGDGGRLIELLGALPGGVETLEFVDCGAPCYSTAWVEAAEAAGITDGVSVATYSVPFAEAGTSAELSQYLYWLGQVDAEATPSATGLSSWAAGRLFEEAVERSIGVDRFSYDPARLSRRGVLDAAATITSWDAHGLHGTSNPAARLPSACVAVLTLAGGQWQRVHPGTEGDFDCDDLNLVTLVDTASLGTAVTGGTADGDAPSPDGG